MIDGMRSTIDHAGRVVIPKSIRDVVGLSAGGAVEIVESNGTVRIEPLPATAEIVETADGPILHAGSLESGLTAQAVRTVLESDRR